MVDVRTGGACAIQGALQEPQDAVQHVMMELRFGHVCLCFMFIHLASGA